MTLPVRVVIPTIPSRKSFLWEVCLPSVFENDPAEVVVVRDEGGAPTKRNRGAQGTSQPYLLFVDDDSRLLPHCLLRMVQAIEEVGPCAAFAYSDFFQIPRGGRFFSGEWSPERLRLNNYIDTTSLIRTRDFRGFDPLLKRFQDWDLWLSVSAAGGSGIYVNSALYEKHTIDRGITELFSENEARRVIAEKHGL